jgi:general secretion pathway protein K
MKKYSRNYTESGIVLIALLWIFIALSAIVLSFARESHVEVAAARNSQSLEQAYYVARAGITETIYRLMYEQYSPRTQQNALQDEPTPLDLGRVTGEFGGGRYTVNIQDETGKVNLNSASTTSEEQLRNLMLAAEIPPADADVITDSILDWLDTDDSSRENGAEDDYYQTLSPPYSAKNGRFEAIEELLLVRGVTPEYFYGRPERADDGSIIYKYGLCRYLTVYSNRNQINVNFAPLPVLLSIPGMTRDSAERIFQRRQTEPFRNTLEISEESVGMLGTTTSQYLTVQTSNTYTLNVSASMGNSKVRRVIRTVVNLDSGQQNFYRILYWNENVPDHVSIPGY